MNIKQIIKRVLNVSDTVLSPVYTLESGNDLAKKTILITGGSSGIGRATAVMAVKRGAEVLVLGRNEDSLKETVSLAGEKCKYLVQDINCIGNIDFAAYETIMGKPIDCLVNNAGIYIENKYLEYSEEDFSRVFETNAKSTFFLTQIFVKYCLERHVNGNIVFTTSNRSLMGDFGPYGMSKAAVNNFIEGMARQNITNRIRVNGVAPGMTASRINHVDVNGNLFTESAKGNRVLLPEEIAETICFLLSDVSKVITGAIIPCDEGDRLR